MKLSRTVGLAVAVSAGRGTVAAIAQISGGGSADPTGTWWTPPAPARAGRLTEPSTKRSGAGRLPPTGRRLEGNARRHASAGAVDAYRRRGTSRRRRFVKEVFATSTN